MGGPNVPNRLFDELIRLPRVEVDSSCDLVHLIKEGLASPLPLLVDLDRYHGGNRLPVALDHHRFPLGRNVLQNSAEAPARLECPDALFHDSYPARMGGYSTVCANCVDTANHYNATGRLQIRQATRCRQREMITSIVK